MNHLWSLLVRRLLLCWSKDTKAPAWLIARCCSDAQWPRMVAEQKDCSLVGGGVEHFQTRQTCSVPRWTAHGPILETEVSYIYHIGIFGIGVCIHHQKCACSRTCHVCNRKPFSLQGWDLWPCLYIEMAAASCFCMRMNHVADAWNMVCGTNGDFGGSLM